LPLYLQDKFIKNVSDVVSKGDKVTVKVLSVDSMAGRIALSMKGLSGERRRRSALVRRGGRNPAPGGCGAGGRAARRAARRAAQARPAAPGRDA
jgi:transcriptional accessory protein Tex/SPT6